MDSGATNVELIRPYLPRLLLHWIAESPETRWQAFDGSLAFVDISGFTKLSERLAKRGKVGAEELTDTIGTCFTRLLAVAYGNGGSLIKFGGDALLVFFAGPAHAEKACRAAVGMRRELREIGKMNCGGVPVRLRMSVGVHTGTFHLFLVGESHKELMITGPAASETVLMESTAEAGEILVSQATASSVPTQCLGAAKGAGMLLRREPPGIESERPEPEPRVDDNEIVRYVPAAVRNQLLAGAHDAEHRRVTIAFVHFDGMDELVQNEGPEAAAEHLDVLVRDVQRAADHNEIAFLASDIDRDGGKIILAGGAPASTGNDEERMLLALREIVDGERRIPVRVGVNRGHVFAGDIGPFYRRTYTVMGDAVNLAARLMAKALPGQILSTEGVLELSHTRFASEELEPFTVKGKARPVRASRVGPVLGARREETDVTIPLIGRERELAVLLGGLASARQGEGKVVEIVGEPGIGKSRLLDEMRERATETIVFSVGCELYGSSIPYGALRGLLRRVLGIGEEAPGETALARLREVLTAIAPELFPWAPLIAIVLDAEMPDTPETAVLDDRFRRLKLNEIVADLMGRILRSPTMIVFDDAHWMDETSADLVRHLERRVRELPWFVCVARRGTSEGFTAGEETTTTTINLQPLAPGDATKMLNIATEEEPMRPDEILALAERGGGNPLYLKELVAAARVGGTVESLPDSVEGLIMARIDRLAPVDRNLLRRASVLGRSFPSDLLIAVLNGETPDASTWRRLDGFLAPDEGGNLSFTNALIRDGAYEGLPYRLRKTLHAQVGETIEKAAGETPDDQAELLSLHFFHARRFVEAWRYALVAAERANAIYANVEAAGFYERALEAARHVDDLVPLEVTRVLEALGDVRNRMGAYTEAATAYAKARRLVAGDRVAEARILLKRAQVQGWLEDYSRALRWISRGMRILRDADDEAAAGQRAQLLAWYAQFYLEEGRPRDAVKWCRRAIEEAEAAGEKTALAQAYKVLDWAYMDLGELEDPVHFMKAIELYEELGDLPSQAAVLNNLGVSRFVEGRWDEALRVFERTGDVAKRAGNAVAAAFSANNIAEILSDQGLLDEAEALFKEASRFFQSAGHRGGQAWAKSNRARVAARAGRYEEALRLYEEAARESREAGAETDALETEARLAECHLLSGDWRSALNAADEGIAHAASRAGISLHLPLLHRVRGFALLRLGEVETAEASLHAGLEAGRARRAQYEIALLTAGLAEAARDRRAEERDAWWAESESILRGLGVRSVPGLSKPESVAITGAGLA